LVVCLAELANHIDSETIRSPIMTKALFISSILTKRNKFRNSVIQFYVLLIKKMNWVYIVRNKQS
jgi:hypothetical protein